MDTDMAGIASMGVIGVRNYLSVNSSEPESLAFAMLVLLGSFHTFPASNPCCRINQAAPDVTPFESK